MTLIDEALAEAAPAAAQVAQDLGIGLFAATLALCGVADALEADPRATARQIEMATGMTVDTVAACLRALAAPEVPA